MTRINYFSQGEIKVSVAFVFPWVFEKGVADGARGEVMVGGGDIWETRASIGARMIIEGWAL